MIPTQERTAPVLLDVSVDDPHVAVITLNRPARRNAVDEATARALAAAMAAFEADPALRAAVLRGAGPAFCAGMDLAAFAAGERPGLTAPEGFAYFVRRRREKPVIAAVNGGAFGGGFEIVLACDLTVAATDASFGLPEVRRGLIAAGGGAVRLPLRLPPPVAREILLTGRPITAERAAALGLVNAVVAPEALDAAALALASTVAANAPLAVAGTRRICDAVEAAAEAAGWARNADLWAQIEASADAREGSVAFGERRAPRWQGR